MLNQCFYYTYMERPQ
uniref:Uncharacterized protein n=1 Tax=Arundo donax TaxID=35708 RepID=A0A0A9GJ18_ARUDO